MEYSEKVFQEGIQIGEKKGLEEGIVWQISKLVADGWSFDEALDLLAKPGMDREDVRKNAAAMVSASRSSELHDNLGELHEDIQRQGPRGRGADG